MSLILKIIALALVTEALVELFFKAAPLRIIRAWLIRHSPLLNTMDQGHLLECKYCTSVWIAAFVVLIATVIDGRLTRLIAFALIVARLSNFLHIIFGFIKDLQFNLRLKR